MPILIPFRRAGLAQKSDDLPALWFGQMGKGWHAGTEGPIPQDPEQHARRGLVDLRSIERRSLPASLAIPSVAGRAFTGVQFCACALCLCAFS